MRLGTRKLSDTKYLTFNNTLTSGITKSNTQLNIVDPASYVQYGDPNLHIYISHFNVNSLIKAVTNANLGFGEHVASFPLGIIKPLGASLEFTGLCATGSASGGEAGLGSVIASGAVATLGGTHTFEDQMSGSTYASFTAATTETKFLENLPYYADSPTRGANLLNGSASAIKCYLNVAQDSDASENFTFSAKVRLVWQWMGTGIAS